MATTTMTMPTTAATAALDAARFMHAWRRFRSRMGSDQITVETAPLLQQFYDMAAAFQQIAHNNQTDAEWHKLHNALQPVADDISSLCSAAHLQQPADPSIRFPRATELLQLKQQRAASTRSPPTTPSPPPPPLPQQHSTQHSVETANTIEQLHADDFRSMLEPPPPQQEKLSIHALRQRIGLVDRDAANAQASASESAVREEQEMLQSDMVALARELKHRTQTINETLVEDVKILDAVGQSAETNTALVSRETAVLEKQLASAIGLWTSLALVGAVVLVFLATYFYIKLFSRRRW